MKVLLIIDMQNAAFNPEYPAYDADGVIERINKLSGLFRQKKHKVIFIQHDGSEEGFLIPDTRGWELLSSLDVKPDDLIIPKTANDSFYKTDLKKILEELNADELVITGSATDLCVDSTVKSALTKDFNVTVISDAHTTEGTPDLTSKQVIDHYNWLWKNMSKTKSKIKVIDLENYLIELNNAY
ncbi:MAG: cysteine hydrolase [Ignavibacteria bacterium]|nr:cysteine hydrolase [Ignavibacteria bacterium]